MLGESKDRGPTLVGCTSASPLSLSMRVTPPAQMSDEAVCHYVAKSSARLRQPLKGDDTTAMSPAHTNPARFTHSARCVASFSTRCRKCKGATA